MKLRAKFGSACFGLLKYKNYNYSFFPFLGPTNIRRCQSIGVPIDRSASGTSPNFGSWKNRHDGQNVRILQQKVSKQKVFGHKTNLCWGRWSTTKWKGFQKGERNLNLRRIFFHIFVPCIYSCNCFSIWFIGHQISAFFLYIYPIFVVLFKFLLYPTSSSILYFSVPRTLLWCCHYA